jgi:hypothetical protein
VRFAVHPRDRARVQLVVIAENLQDDVTVEANVVGAIYLGRSTATLER